MDEQSGISPFRTGLASACPRCGNGKLFSGLLEVADVCNFCDLDYADHDAGDGPVALIILLLGFVMVSLALWLEFTFHPPFWVHVVLCVPMTIICSILLLRVFKATLVALQFRHQAGEAREE